MTDWPTDDPPPEEDPGWRWDPWEDPDWVPNWRPMITVELPEEDQT